MLDGISPLKPGENAPALTLPLLDGGFIDLSESAPESLILNFWSVDCPWCEHYDAYFAGKVREWAAGGTPMIMIMSNPNEDDAQIREKVTAIGLETPILLDRDQAAADAYGATTTPHLYLIHKGQIVYQGAVDDRSFRQRQPTVNHLEAALNALQRGDPLPVAETPAYGCAILRELPQG
jgi:peroxiredoxin